MWQWYTMELYKRLILTVPMSNLALTCKSIIFLPVISQTNISSYQTILSFFLRLMYRVLDYQVKNNETIPHNGIASFLKETFLPLALL